MKHDEPSESGRDVVPTRTLRFSASSCRVKLVCLNESNDTFIIRERHLKTSLKGDVYKNLERVFTMSFTDIAVKLGSHASSANLAHPKRQTMRLLLDISRSYIYSDSRVKNSISLFRGSLMNTQSGNDSYKRNELRMTKRLIDPIKRS